MGAGVCLDFGANVVPLAGLDIKSAYAPVPILLLPAAGRNVQVKTEKQGLVMVKGAQVSKTLWGIAHRGRRGVIICRDGEGEGGFWLCYDRIYSIPLGSVILSWPPLPPHWALIDSNFSIVPLFHSVGEDWSSLMKTMCCPPKSFKPPRR